MANTTHLKVLLKKDFLTLRRNLGFIIAFIVLPLGLMNAFIAIEGLVDNGDKEGSLIRDNFHFTSNVLLNLSATPPAPINFMDVPFADLK